MTAPVVSDLPSPDLPSAGRIEGREHLLPVRVYYEDTDFTGLVYHASYVRFFERGRSDFLRLTSLGHAELLDGDAPMAFVIAELDLRFHKPARIDDALIVRTTLDAITGPRLMFSQGIERDGVTLCTARVTAICIHLDGRPRRPTRALIRSVTPWLSPTPPE